MISSAHGSSSSGHSGRPTQIVESAPPPLVLEIRSGQTQFPLRPVTSNRFLIGAGEGCDLRLGGDDMPPLHSIVHVDHVEALLETVALTPPLKVNGLVVESVLLQDGDRIGIGPFELLAHRPSSAVEMLPDETHSANEVEVIVIDDDAAMPSPVSELSATELADRIEDEERQLARFEQRRQLGANALLDAVAERIDFAAAGLLDSENDRPAAADNGDGPAIAADAASDQTGDQTGARHEELLRLLEQANTLADELKQRTKRLADREAAQVERTEAVFESQQELAIRLESLVSRIADLQERRLSQYPKVA